LVTSYEKTRTAHRLLAPRRMTAILAVLATLFQAMLVAWHHHSLPLSSRTVSPIAVAAAIGLRLPAAIDHDCEICFVVGHHHEAVPIDPLGTTASESALLRDSRIEAVVTFITAYFLFRSRAPPLG
jgi:hypothetical protein